MIRATTNLRNSLPFFYYVAAGAVEGINIVKRFGYNPNVASSLATIWDEGGLYVYPPSASVMGVASTDTNDAFTGDGARTVKIIGLNEDWLEISEEVELDGQDPVYTENQFTRVFRASVESAGATGYAEGNIYVGTGAFSVGVPANKYARISGINNQTQMAMFTVPDDKVCFIGDYYNNTGKSGEATVNSYVRDYGGVFKNKRIVSIFESSFFFPNNFPFYFLPRTDIEIRGTSSVGTPVSAGFDLILVDKDKIFQ